MDTNLPTQLEIPSPELLFQLVENLRQQVNNGNIVEISGSCRLSEIVKGKPWPKDVIEIDFLEVSTKYKFKLACETYHGFGGNFSRAEKAFYKKRKKQWKGVRISNDISLILILIVAGSLLSAMTWSILESMQKYGELENHIVRLNGNLSMAFYFAFPLTIFTMKYIALKLKWPAGFFGSALCFLICFASLAGVFFFVIPKLV